MSDSESRRSRRKRKRQSANPVSQGPRLSGLSGGRYRPLDEPDLALVDQAVRHILQDVGMAEVPGIVVERVSAAGGRLDNDHRLHFPAELIEKALQGMARNFSLCGQQAEHDLQLSAGRVHAGSGGAAPMILDLVCDLAESYL